MKIKKIFILIIICILLFLVIWGTQKIRRHISSKADLFIVGCEEMGWNTLVEKPVRISGLNDLWQVHFIHGKSRLIAFGNFEQPTNKWKVGDEVLIISVSKESFSDKTPFYFFKGHRKKK